MKTPDHNKTVTLTTKHVVALVIASVFVSVLIVESRKLAKDHRTWSTWVLAVMVVAVLAATASTLWLRRSRKRTKEL